MKKLIILCTILLVLGTNISYAVDLDAPAEKKITVKMELERGQQVIFNLDGWKTGFKDHAKGIELAIATNKRDMRDTDAFYVGAYFAAWKSSLGFAAHKKDEAANAAILKYFKLFRGKQHQLDIDDKTLCQVLGWNYDSLEQQLTEWDAKL